MARVRVTAALATALAAMGMAATRSVSADVAYQQGGAVQGGQPFRGTAGMARGTKTRGNRAVQRAARKARNVRRHRAACRG
jgi:hypothetical protein